MTSSRFLVGSLLPILLSLSSSAAGAAELPAALLRLIPADPLAVVVTPSLEEFTRDLRTLAEAIGEDDPQFDPFVLLGDSTGSIRGEIDPVRPAVIALRLSEGAPAPAVIGVLALRDPGLDATEFAMRTGAEVLALEDGWIVVGEDPTYSPGGSRPALLNDLPSADLAARLDLRSIFQQFGPMIEMFLAMALAQQEPTDDEGGVPPPPARVDVEAALELLALVRDGIRTLELAVDVEGTLVEVLGGVDLDPDGPLAPGTQPEREEALDLAARLQVGPEDVLVGASALDLAPFARFNELMMRIGAAMTDTTGAAADSAIATGFAEDVYAMLWHPYAWAGQAGPEGMRARSLIRAHDPDSVVDAFVEAVNAMPQANVHLRAGAEREIEGAKVRAYEYDFIGVESIVSSDSVSAEAMQSWLRSVMGGFEIATRGTTILWAMGVDASATMDALVTAEPVAGDVPARLVDVRRWAGPEARAWSWMDLQAMLALVARWAATMPQQEGSEIPDLEDLDDPVSLPVFGCASIERSWLRGRVMMDARAIAAFVEQVEALEGD